MCAMPQASTRISAGASRPLALKVRRSSLLPASAMAAPPRGSFSGSGEAGSDVFRRHRLLLASAGFQQGGGGFGVEGALFLELRGDDVLAAGLALGFVGAAGDVD